MDVNDALVHEVHTLMQANMADSKRSRQRKENDKFEVCLS